MKTVSITKTDVKMLISSVCATPCKVTDASLSFQFSCNPKLLILLRMFNSIDEYAYEMSKNRNVLYFERKLIWDVDDDLTASIDMMDDKGIVKSIMVLLDGDGKDAIKGMLRDRLGGCEPVMALSNQDMRRELSRIASIQMAAPLLGAENRLF